MANNNDTPIKMLQFLRISNIYDSKETAIEALNNITNSSMGKRLEDGTPILARFGSINKPSTLMGIFFKREDNAFVTIIEGRDDIYNIINDLYGITDDLEYQISNVRGELVTINGEIDGLKEVDRLLQDEIDILIAKKTVIESNPDNDYITISSSTVGNITTYIINETHEFDMGTW